MLAEMAIEALRGKVSGTVLAILLNALNYEKDKEAAYRQGELDGRNAKMWRSISLMRMTASRISKVAPGER